jgi:hypothetical protein
MPVSVLLGNGYGLAKKLYFKPVDTTCCQHRFLSANDRFSGQKSGIFSKTAHQRIDKRFFVAPGTYHVQIAGFNGNVNRNGAREYGCKPGELIHYPVPGKDGMGFPLPLAAVLQVGYVVEIDHGTKVRQVRGNVAVNVWVGGHYQQKTTYTAQTA